MFAKFIARFYGTSTALGQNAGSKSNAVAKQGTSKFQNKFPQPNKSTADESSFQEYNKADTAVNLDWDRPYFFHKWPTWVTNRDVTRRKVVKEYAPQRLRLVAMLRAVQLPKAFREKVSEELETLPRYSRYTELKNICLISGRTHGNVVRYRLSRFCFRKRADHGRLSGVIRAVCNRLPQRMGLSTSFAIVISIVLVITAVNGQNVPKESEITRYKFYHQDYPVIFNIVLWFSVSAVVALLFIGVAMWNMDPGRDSIIYRMTMTRAKKD